MPEPVFASPLDGRSALSGLAVALAEVSDRGMIDLRGDARDPAFRQAVESVLDLPLPLEPRTSSIPSRLGGGAGGVGEPSQSPCATAALWLSPDQWLILCPRADAPTLLARLEAALDSLHAFAVDVSDMRCIIRVEGAEARTVLMKAAPVDLTVGYGAGSVRRLRYGEIAALLHVVAADPDVIDLYVFRSYAAHAWDMLLATSGSGSAVTLFGRQDPPAV